MNDLTYVVLPQPPILNRVDKPALSYEVVKHLRERAMTVGLVAWLLFIMILATALSLLAIRFDGVWILPIGIISLLPAVVIALITHRLLATKAERKQQQQNDARQLERLTREAQTRTDEVRSIYRLAVAGAVQVREHLAHASGWLRTAESEYRARAFDPYWTAIEHAANHLAEGIRKTKELAARAETYYKKLAGQKHTFPAFPAHRQSLPTAEPIAAEFCRVVRLGQTNFEFANIWEHRRTREVLIAGFRSLGDAVNNLGTLITDSLRNLQYSTTSDIARLVQEEINTRDKLDRRAVEQNRMLDNLQSRREPTALDRPSQY